MNRGDFLKSLAALFVAPKLIGNNIDTENLQPIAPEIPKPQRFFTKDDWEDTRISQFTAGEELRVGDVVGLYHDGKVRLVRDPQYIFGKTIHVERKKNYVWVEH